MPLAPYQYHPSGSKASTPSPILQQGGHGRRTSASSLWSSPDSVDTRATTPNISPPKHHGREILPRIRPCDQTLEQEHPAFTNHRRAQSYDYEGALSLPQNRPGYQRSTTCPPEYDTLPTPASPTPAQESWTYSTYEPPVNLSASYNRRNLGHARSTSTSALNASQMRRYAYPSRTVPIYLTQNQAPQYVNPMDTTQLAYDFMTNPMIPVAPHPLSRGVTPDDFEQVNQIEYDPFYVETGSEPTTSMLSYLTSPNPAIHPISATSLTSGGGDKTGKHCWWDIRQLRKWSSFNIATILSIPGFEDLLSISINASALPSPAPTSTRPHDLTALQSILTQHHAFRTNAALTASFPPPPTTRPHMRPETTSRDGPHFFCAPCVNDSEIPSSRARCIGLVKGYESWNSGMRHEGPVPQIEYLKGLAQLQWMMREQECRYGYILTEIELVCVRMGTEPTVPFFGRLELSAPIPMSRHGNAEPELTVGLALWFLHMLTRDEPLPGELGWRVCIGAPADRTRARACKDEERDEWVRKLRGPLLTEGRKAKKIRGWIHPGDEYRPKVEGGRMGKRGRRE